MNNKEQAEVTLERGKVYGPVYESHKNIGLSWTAIIQQHYGIKLDHPLTVDIVALMMTAFKVQRSTRVFHPDNFIDLHNYADYAKNYQESPSVPYEQKLTQEWKENPQYKTINTGPTPALYI